MASSDQIQAPENPFALFGDWFQSIQRAGIENPDAVIVSTVDSAGHPEARVVLMRRWNARGFAFFTNYQSSKSKSILEMPWGHMCFHWQVQEKQVRIQGLFEKTTSEESDDYWTTRPWESQINALASSQSSPMNDRTELEARVQRLTQEYQGKKVPRPPHWGGWRLIPWRMEFWLGHPFRLHDRVVYQRFSNCPEPDALLDATPGGDSGTSWTHFRLQP